MSRHQLAISVKNLGKRYSIAPQQGVGLAPTTLGEALWSRLRGGLGRDGGRQKRTDFWALKDVSFDIHKGEVVGIIGRNGAGKSTLLKTLSRITAPTTGRIQLYGRVGSLLEVGTGFHPELTGRENIFLNGSILGMRRTEIQEQFDAIVSFAELEQFLDTPVKRYSSGMYVRLAFAVAAHLNPEILIVDEVLAVGDASFQKKCIGKMQEVAEKGMRTVVFVSHNMTAVHSLCTRVICLNGGTVQADGPTGTVTSQYLSSAPLTEQAWDRENAPGDNGFHLNRVCVFPRRGNPSDPVTVRTPASVEFDYWNDVPGRCLNLNIRLFNKEGILVFSSYPGDESFCHGKPFPAGLFRTTCQIPGDLLNDGVHRLELLAVEDQAVVLYRHEDVLCFDVIDSAELRGAWHGQWPGAVRPNLFWETQLLEPSRESQGDPDSILELASS
jgi:lipopolysaccharide transport system ATP-binding protein